MEQNSRQSSVSASDASHHELPVSNVQVPLSFPSRPPGHPFPGAEPILNRSLAEVADQPAVAIGEGSSVTSFRYDSQSLKWPALGTESFLGSRLFQPHMANGSPLTQKHSQGYEFANSFGRDNSNSKTDLVGQVRNMQLPMNDNSRNIGSDSVSNFGVDPNDGIVISQNSAWVEDFQLAGVGSMLPLLPMAPSPAVNTSERQLSSGMYGSRVEMSNNLIEPRTLEEMVADPIGEKGMERQLHY